MSEEGCLAHPDLTHDRLPAQHLIAGVEVAVRVEHKSGHLRADGGKGGIQLGPGTRGGLEVAVPVDRGNRDLGSCGIERAGVCARQGGSAVGIHVEVVEPHGNDLGHRVNGSRRNVGGGEVTHDRDAEVAPVETERVGADDRVGQPADSTLVDGAVLVDEGVVADVAPASDRDVVAHDAPDDAGGLFRGVGVRAGGVVDGGRAGGVCPVGHAAVAQGLVSPPLRAGHDRQLHGGGGRSRRRSGRRRRGPRSEDVQLSGLEGASSGRSRPDLDACHVEPDPEGLGPWTLVPSAGGIDDRFHWAEVPLAPPRRTEGADRGTGHVGSPRWPGQPDHATASDRERHDEVIGSTGTADVGGTAATR